MLSNCFFVKLFNVYPGTGKMQQAPDGSGDFHIKSKEICSSYLLGLTNAVLVPQPQKVHSGSGSVTVLNRKYMTEYNVLF